MLEKLVGRTGAAEKKRCAHTQGGTQSKGWTVLASSCMRFLLVFFFAPDQKHQEYVVERNELLEVCQRMGTPLRFLWSSRASRRQTRWQRTDFSNAILEVEQGRTAFEDRELSEWWSFCVVLPLLMSSSAFLWQHHGMGGDPTKRRNPSPQTKRRQLEGSFKSRVTMPHAVKWTV